MNNISIMNKKGAENLWWIIMWAVVAIIAVIFLIIWFRSSGEKGYGAIGKEIGELDDCDGDKVSDFFDKCVCDQGENDGCPDLTDEQLKPLKDKKKSDPGCCKP